jgi:hypothetical protein
MYAQTDNAYTLSGTQKTETSLPAGTLNARAHKWVTDKLATAYDVVKTDEVAGGGVTVTARRKYNMDIKRNLTYAPGYIEFTVTINVTNGGYSYTIGNFTHVVTHEDYTAFGLVTTNPESLAFMWQALGNKHTADKRLDELQDFVKERAYYIADGLTKFMATSVAVAN